MKTNPLLDSNNLPQFEQINTKHFKPAITGLLKESRAATKKLLKQKNYTWNNLINPLEEIDAKLAFAWSAISHLNSVIGTKEIRASYEQCLPLITQYVTENAQNVALYKAILTIAESKQYLNLDSTQKRIIDNQLRDFRLSGVDLPSNKKAIFMQLMQDLAKLENKFNSNVIDSSQSYSLCLNKKQIQGLPEYALAMGQANAQTHNETGWCFSLDFPSYQALITYADSSSVRKQIHTAFISRASDIGPGGAKYDNAKIIEKILKIRKKLVKLVGFDNFAEYSLATKMAESPTQVLDFLNNLVDKSLAAGKQEAKELEEFAKKLDCKKLAPWDIAYYEEKLSQEKFKFSAEELRPYFPDTQVLEGLFAIAKRLYGITITEKSDFSTWHPSVKFFTIYDEKEELIGAFYADLYCRTGKRNGAWMDECMPHIAHLVCNFAPPINDGEPSLLTHDDVVTLFHEFGHCMHHVLTKVPYSAAAGIKNVPWDAVELPSQFMENWCWQEKSLKIFARHYKTHKSIPKDLVENLLVSHNYHAATHMLRQVRLSLMDFRIHLEFDTKQKNQLEDIIKQINKKINFLPISKHARTAHSFTHIFAGGYAAGYYSYKWAEVLSADAFAKFEDKGIFHQATGRSFLQNILEMGGSEDPMILFEKFRGRKPQIDALLKQHGIIK